MNSKKIITLSLPAILLAALLAATQTRAATNEPISNTPIQNLDLDLCLKLTVDWALSTGRLGRQTAMALANADETRSQSWPHLNLRAGGRFEMRNSDILPEADGDFGDTFLQLPQNAARRRIAAMGMICARHFETRTLCVLRARAMRAYAAFLRAEAKLNMAEEQSMLADLLETAWQRAPQHASLSERRKESDAMIRNQPLLLEQAQLEQVLAAKRLFIMTDLAESTNRITVAALPNYEAPSIISVEQCLAWALAKRSDLLALQEQILMQEQAIRLARLARLPTPALSFGYRDSQDADADNAFEGAYLKAMLKIPLWDAGAISAQTARLAAERTRTILEHEDLQAEITAAVAKAYTAWRRAIETLNENDSTPYDPESRRKRADIRLELGDLSKSQHQTEIMCIREQESNRLNVNLTCYEAETDLLEAIQAERASFVAGLKETP